MKKLLYLSNLRLPTEKAYGIQIAKMCEAFAAQVEVELVYPSRKNPIKEDVFIYYAVKQIFKIKKLSAIDFYLPGPFDRIAVDLKSFISAVVLSFYGLFSGTDIIYSRDEAILYILSFFKKNIVFEAHRYSPKRKFFYKRFKNASIKTVVISKAIEQEFFKLGFSEKNILVAHDGVDIEKFDININKEKARKMSRLPLDKILITYAGHLFEWKGVDVLLEATRDIEISKYRNMDILFVFLGGTERDVKKFRKKAKGLNNVLILGHRPHKEIPLFLKAADALVLPNSVSDKISSYTSPLKLFEYMASKRPIVASELPSIAEILNDGNSVLVKPDDPKKLVEGIKKILEDTDASADLAIRAFEEVQQYTWQKRAGKIINFIF